jgi:putative endonuclease
LSCKFSLIKFVWLKRMLPLYLHSRSRSRAAVARRAHNPKVLGSIPSFATKALQLEGFLVMFTVYLLNSSSTDKIYIGYTSNLEARLLSHNQLGTKGWIIKFRPWTVIHTEVFSVKADALKREQQLKSAQGRQWIREKLIKH